jgi:SepF-like predicted cell division protein (DUF552 family)
MVKNTNNSRSRIYISQRQLNEKDLSQIEKDLRGGQILFLKTGQFFEQYQDEVIKLKGAMDQLKKICLSFGGSIGRIGPDLLVLTPSEKIKLY